MNTQTDTSTTKGKAAFYVIKYHMHGDARPYLTEPGTPWSANVANAQRFGTIGPAIFRIADLALRESRLACKIVHVEVAPAKREVAIVHTSKIDATKPVVLCVIEGGETYYVNSHAAASQDISTAIVFADLGDALVHLANRPVSGRALNQTLHAVNATITHTPETFTETVVE